MSVPDRTVSNKDRLVALHGKARRHGYRMSYAACKSYFLCNIKGSYHVSMGGKGRFKNQLSIAEAEELLNKWIKEDKG